MSCFPVVLPVIENQPKLYTGHSRGWFVHAYARPASRADSSAGWRTLEASRSLANYGRWLLCFPIALFSFSLLFLLSIGISLSLRQWDHRLFNREAAPTNRGRTGGVMAISLESSTNGLVILDLDHGVGSQQTLVCRFQGILTDRASITRRVRDIRRRNRRLDHLHMQPSTRDRVA